jgi:hypothetical protein
VAAATEGEAPVLANEDRMGLVERPAAASIAEVVASTAGREGAATEPVTAPANVIPVVVPGTAALGVLTVPGTAALGAVITVLGAPVGGSEEEEEAAVEDAAEEAVDAAAAVAAAADDDDDEEVGPPAWRRGNPKCLQRATLSISASLNGRSKAS